MSELHPALQDYQDGLPVVDICERYFIDPATLWRWRRKAGLPQRRRSAPVRERVLDVMQRYPYLQTRQIAMEAETSREYVQYVKRKARNAARY